VSVFSKKAGWVQKENQASVLLVATAVPNLDGGKLVEKQANIALDCTKSVRRSRWCTLLVRRTKVSCQQIESVHQFPKSGEGQLMYPVL